MELTTRLKLIKLKLSYLKSALRYKPYDYGYMLDTMKKQIDMIIFYREKGLFYTEWKDFRYVYIAKSIIEEICENEMKEDTYVNLKNEKRFIKIKETLSLKEEYRREEIRWNKLFNILGKIFSRKLQTWWD